MGICLSLNIGKSKKKLKNRDGGCSGFFIQTVAKACGITFPAIICRSG